ncbi:MAG: hypothetical protein AAB581_02765 [Patescibacteria group bacterium]
MNTNEEKNIVNLRPATPVEHMQTTHGGVAWETEEFPYHEKDQRWFLTGGIVLAAVCISLIILKNIFGAALMLLFSVILYLYATKRPEILSVVIDGTGISVNNKRIAYNDVSSFWILYELPVKDLIIIKKDRFAVKTIIPLGSVNPVSVREVLKANAVPEKEEEESLVDILARRFRF